MCLSLLLCPALDIDQLRPQAALLCTVRVIFFPCTEFIRMAARFGATIVPFAAVGVDDSLNILADNQQLEALPVVGDMLRQLEAGLLGTDRQA